MHDSNTVISTLAHDDKGKILLASSNIVNFLHPAIAETATLLTNIRIAIDFGFRCEIF